MSGRQLCVWQDNQQLLADKVALQAIVQIIHDRLVRLCYSVFKRVDFQRPDWICTPFCPTFKLSRLVGIRRQVFSFTPRGLEYGVEGFATTPFSLIAAAGFLPVRQVTSLLRAATTAGSVLTYAVDHWPEGRSISTAY